jgi:hypothetical protein
MDVVIALGLFLLSLNASAMMVSPSTGTGCVFRQEPAAPRWLASAPGPRDGPRLSKRCRQVRQIQRWLASDSTETTPAPSRSRENP